MSTEKTDAKRRLYLVSHPDFGTARVSAQDGAEAIGQAAKNWGVPFREIAGYCTVTDLGPALPPRCQRCHSEYGSPGDPKGYCPSCKAILARQRREAQRYATQARMQRKKREEESR